MTNKKVILASFLVLAVACGPNNLQPIEQASQQLSSTIGCTNYEERTIRVLQSYLVDHQQMPSAEDLKLHLKSSLKTLKATDGKITTSGVSRLNAKLNELVDLLLVEAPQLEKVQTPDELLTLLSSIKTGDQSTDMKSLLLKKTEAKFAEVETLVQEMAVSCQLPEETNDAVPEATPLLEAAALGATVYGARLALATAYQTCEALEEPIMTDATPDVRGITRTGTRPDGGGIRVVSSASSLVKSQPYYKNVNSYDAKCVDMRSTPLIYDFGGKPGVTSSSSSTLNFFKNAGSGTKALGFDCSGYVYSAVTSAGLRFTPNKNPDPIDVFSYGASRFANPEGNRMTCFKKISVTPKENLKAGDIVATSGHIVIIDSVGADPFGLNRASSLSACGNLSYRNFDFVVAQSSPSKDGIGVNRFVAKDYLGENQPMQDTLESYAKAACQAKFNNKSYTPATSKSAVVRHTMTSECLGRRIALENESCVASCGQLKR